MLIKYYTSKYPSDVHIIDSVSNVKIISQRITIESGDDQLSVSNKMSKFSGDNADISSYILDDVTGFGDIGALAMVVEFYKDAGYCQLLVMNKAYICNGDGKTIHVVEP